MLGPGYSGLGLRPRLFETKGLRIPIAGECSRARSVSETKRKYCSGIFNGLRLREGSHRLESLLGLQKFEVPK